MKMPYNHPDTIWIVTIKGVKREPKKGRKHANEDKSHPFPLPFAPLSPMGHYTEATFLDIVGVLKLLSLGVAG